LERRISSLSGSTNKADIAERRKLEAELYESRESLNDTYYDHAQEAQTEALDAEAVAYEETMTKMVEGMRTSLEEATADMGAFLNGVTVAVSMNADTVLEKYKDTELHLDPALTNPWVHAAEKVGKYGDDATKLMDVWKKDGYFAEFSSTAGANLSSPWNVGKAAVQSFANSVSTNMSSVYESIRSNVQESITKLNELKAKYAELQDTNIPPPSGGGGGYGDNSPEPQKKKKYWVIATLNIGDAALRADAESEISADDAKLKARIALLGKYEKIKGNSMAAETQWQRKWRNEIKYDVAQYASGTLGTKRDELAITDESWIGEEITLAAGKHGQLQYLKKGSAVMPADISANLVEWGKLNPDMFNVGGGVNLTMINNAVNKPEITIDVENFLKVDRVDKDALPQLEAMMDKKIDTLMRQLNYSVKKFAR
jgi:hypothetical protein